MKSVLLVANDHRVPGVVAAVKLDDVVSSTREKVSRLALTFIAPLCTDDHDCWHGGPFVGRGLHLSLPVGPNRAESPKRASRRQPQPMH